MRGFSSYIIVILIFISALMFNYISILSSTSYEKADSFEINELSFLIKEQSRIVEKGKNVLIYCKKPTNFSFNSSLKVNGCNITYEGFKTKNCMFDVLGIANDYIKDKNITNATLIPIMQGLENKIEENGYDCYSNTKHIDGCGDGFEVVCNVGPIETNESFENRFIYIRGG